MDQLLCASLLPHPLLVRGTHVRYGKYRELGVRDSTGLRGAQSRGEYNI